MPDAEPRRRRRWPWIAGAVVVLTAGAAFVFVTEPRSDTDFVGNADSLCKELRVERLSEVAGIPLTPSDDPPDSMTCLLVGPTPAAGRLPAGEAFIRFSMNGRGNVDFGGTADWNADSSGIDGIGWKKAGDWDGRSMAKIISLLGTKSAQVAITSSQSNFGDAAMAIALLNEWLV